MRRIVLHLVLVGLLVGLAGPAVAGWVWRDGKWIYTESPGPRVPGQTTPAQPPPPVAPTPKPEPDAPPSPPATTPPATTPPGARPPRPAAPKPDRSPAPGGPDTQLFEQAQAYLQAGRTGTAARRLKKLIKDYPTSPHREDAIWLRGGILFDQKDYYKAYEQYEELLTQYAGSRHYRNALLKEIEVAELFFGPVRRRVLGIPLLSGESEAVEILRRVYEHQPAGDLADDVVLRIADYYWSKRLWTEAEDYYDKYCREYPNGDAVLHAELQRARCAIERCRGPRYDTTPLRLAYDRLRQFQKKFPEEAERQGVPAMLDTVRETQAQAMYEVAARYRRGGEPLAAAFYAERLRERFPHSPWSEKAGTFLAGSTKFPEPPNGSPPPETNPGAGQNTTPDQQEPTQ